jgi:hypothetical protein
MYNCTIQRCYIVSTLFTYFSLHYTRHGDFCVLYNEFQN